MVNLSLGGMAGSRKVVMEVNFLNTNTSNKSFKSLYK